MTGAKCYNICKNKGLCTDDIIISHLYEGATTNGSKVNFEPSCVAHQDRILSALPDIKFCFRNNVIIDNPLENQ